MNKKISLGIAISLVAIGCAITFVLTWTVSLNIYNSKIGTSEKYEGVYAKLREIDTAVRQNYIGTVSDDALEASTINGYIAGIGDKYASYSTPSAYYELQQSYDGVILGAGFDAEENGSGYLTVTTVYKGSSAELNGVKVGDVITAIDGKSLLSMEPGQAFRWRQFRSASCGCRRSIPRSQRSLRVRSCSVSEGFPAKPAPVWHYRYSARAWRATSQSTLSASSWRWNPSTAACWTTALDISR